LRFFRIARIFERMFREIDISAPLSFGSSLSGLLLSLFLLVPLLLVRSAR